MKYNKMLFRVSAIGIVAFSICISSLMAQNNLALTGTASASSSQKDFGAEKAIDGKVSAQSKWKNQGTEEAAWLMVKLPGATEIHQVKLKSSLKEKPVSDFKIQTMLNGTWRNIKEVDLNDQQEFTVIFDKPVLTDRIRLLLAGQEVMEVAELEIYGQPYIDTSAMAVKDILVNQSGYNLYRPKRFTAPEMLEKRPFQIKRLSDGQEVYSGSIIHGIGDFSDFNPLSAEEFRVVADGSASFPFRIGPYWLERVTYRNMLDFMIGARHYVGTTDKIRPLSWEWRDGDFFNWGLQSLIALYLANPAAFEQMEQTIAYVPNSSFPVAYKGLWGTLEPYDPSTPDIIQLIHWDVDVKISQNLEHEMQKAELAHFLYAWPYLKKWLPRQNYSKVYAYVKEKWEKPTVGEHSTSKYDLSPEHNLLSLKIQLGTTKGELPPGHSVIPNLMMYEVAKREKEEDADKYFNAAYRQMEWMIENLDWEDPMVTKGQRMSEHITMRAFAYFYHQYPDKAPQGIRQKVKDWAKVALARSDNFWDFRKYAEEEWTPPSWNETGNVLGFPAAAFAAMSVLEEKETVRALEILAWSHIDNAFGRNPVGRHFSYNGPEEIEGVDLGWYNSHKGGIGLLEEVPFVFDGSPKSFHYPNQPEVGNLGWTEGWVQFNTAFNTSMAYLANYYTEVSVKKTSEHRLQIELTAPINLYEDKKDSAAVRLINGQGEEMKVYLKETGPFSNTLTGELTIEENRVRIGTEVLSLRQGETLTVAYGYGYFKKEARFRF